MHFMARPRNKAERLRDRKRAASLYLRGKHQQEIADELGIDQSTVSRDLSYLHKEWEEAAKEDYGRLRGREIAKTYELERTYWEAWLASKSLITIRGRGEEDAIVTQKDTPGDSSFLAGVERCMKMRADLLGLDAPKAVAIVDEDFDQEAWAKRRNARHAAALEALEEAENGDAE